MKVDPPSFNPDCGVLNFDRSIAVGFLLSYAFLVKHQLDFVLAKESNLIPEDVEWASWSKFINNFRKFEDHHVANRTYVANGSVCRCQL